MKRKTNIKYQPVVWAISLLAFFYSCNDAGDLGMELLPTKDLIEIKNKVDNNSTSYTYKEGPIRTDEPSKNLLGSMNDPSFGKSDINFASQFRLLQLPEFGTNAIADSVNLYLYYKVVYGDTSTVQTIRVYELEDDLILDEEDEQGKSTDYPYYQDVDLKTMASSKLLGEIDYKPKIKLADNDKDTLYQVIKIPIDISLGEKLVNADPSQMVNPELFLNFFKGLYIETEKPDDKIGAIMSIETSSSGSFQGSALAVFYNNDENKKKDKPDTLMNPYVITQFSARVNSFTHDYTKTPFYSYLNTETKEDSLIYIQPTGGLESKIYIKNLSSWKDSVNVAINKAELIFQIDTLASKVDKYPVPSKLLLTYINKEEEKILPDDYWFYPVYYGGYLEKNYTYRFNITQHLQNIIEGKIEDNGFYLSSIKKNSEANRAIIKGSKSKTGINLVITYSKFQQ